MFGKYALLCSETSNDFRRTNMLSLVSQAQLKHSGYLDNSDLRRLCKILSQSFNLKGLKVELVDMMAIQNGGALELFNSQ